jgi:hypothetical protein
MPNIPEDIFTEPDASPDTLANLGPLRRLAGEWQSDQGVDINPKADGPERRVFREHIRMEPIDSQANGPQVTPGSAFARRLSWKKPFAPTTIASTLPSTTTAAGRT